MNTENEFDQRLSRILEINNLAQTTYHRIRKNWFGTSELVNEIIDIIIQIYKLTEVISESMPKGFTEEVYFKALGNYQSKGLALFENFLSGTSRPEFWRDLLNIDTFKLL